MRILCAALAIALLATTPARAIVDYHLELLTTDLHIPVAAEMAPGIDDKIFIAQLGGFASDGSDGDDITKAEGRVVVYDRTTGQVDYINPLLVIDDTSLVEYPNPEVGLFSMAFHPDFQSNGKFYVNVAVEHDGPAPTVDTRVSPFKTVVREYTIDLPSLTVTQPPRTILELDQPQVNHNGSWIGFSPTEVADGKRYLYVTQGDGGDQHDPAQYGQDPGSWFGTVMRVDVSDGADAFPGDPDRNYGIPADNPFVGGGGAPEVWAYGLRNPWRASFDAATGDFWIGDVGQGRYEEIDFQPADSPGGENYGWRLREGFHETPTGGANVGGPQPPDGVDPVYEYQHGFDEFEGNSVTGGYVYRGPSADLQGRYIFADNVSGHIWSFDPADPAGTVENMDELLNPYGNIFAISSFGEDEAGNLLIVDGAGALYQVAKGARSDFDDSGQIDLTDWQTFAENHLADLSAFTGPQQYARGDLDLDGDNDYFDFLLFEADFNAANGPGALAALRAVPEPAAAWLAVCAILVGWRRRRRPVLRKL